MYMCHLASVDIFVFVFVIVFVLVLAHIYASPDKCTDHCPQPSHLAAAAPNSEVKSKLEIAVVQNLRLKIYFRISGENGI